MAPHNFFRLHSSTLTFSGCNVVQLDNSIDQRRLNLNISRGICMATPGKPFACFQAYPNVNWTARKIKKNKKILKLSPIQRTRKMKYFTSYLYSINKDAKTLTNNISSMVNSTPIAYKIAKWTRVIYTIYVVMYSLMVYAPLLSQGIISFVRQSCSSRKSVFIHLYHVPPAADITCKNMVRDLEAGLLLGSSMIYGFSSLHQSAEGSRDSTQVSRSSSKQTAYRGDTSPAVFSQ
jgi:hypothetical protein